MRTGHNAVAAARVSRVNQTYSLQAKAAPPLPPMGGMTPGAEMAPPPTSDELQAHEWAGDLYEQGDQSDPMEAFARFEGVDGETAWLDRADDGTLTGWVQDADGSVYRYSDDAAWAIDVDQAGMHRNDVPTDDVTADGEVADEPVDGEEPAVDPETGELPAEPADEIPPADDAPADDVDTAALTDAIDEGFTAGGADLPEEGEPIGDAGPAADPDAGVEPDAEDPEADEPEDDEDDALPFQTKSWSAPGGGRFRIRLRGGPQ